MVGHITYLSEEAMKQKFGRDLKYGSLDQTELTDVPLR
jgi:homoserine acetyltransferase